jgi:hypothetical protein
VRLRQLITELHARLGNDLLVAPPSEPVAAE